MLLTEVDGNRFELLYNSESRVTMVRDKRSLNVVILHGAEGDEVREAVTESERHPDRVMSELWFQGGLSSRAIPPAQE